jgi:hypothetical protein
MKARSHCSFVVCGAKTVTHEKDKDKANTADAADVSAVAERRRQPDKRSQDAEKLREVEPDDTIEGEGSPGLTIGGGGGHA